MLDPENNAPSINSIEATTDWNSEITIELEAKDIDAGDKLTFSVSDSDKEGGSISIDIYNGTVTFMPDEKFLGTVEFEVMVTDNSGSTDIATVKVRVTDPWDFVSLCESAQMSGTVNELIFDSISPINFPSNGSCAWGQDGNGRYLRAETEPFGNGRIGDGYITARYKQRFQILPDQRSGSVANGQPHKYLICTVNFSSKAGATWRYDDHMFLTINDNVIATDQGQTLSDRFELKNGFYQFDWDNLIGSKHSGQPYTLDGAFKFPGSDSTGEVSINLDVSEHQNLAKNILEGSSRTEINSLDGLFLDLHITGDDNNDKDCKHSGLILEGTVRYLEIPW